MALTPNIRSLMGRSLVTERQNAAQMRLTMGNVLATLNRPADFMRAQQGGIEVAFRQAADLRVTYANTMALGRGYTANPRVRAFTFTLDGHDFYVLQIGKWGTLVYDDYSKKWSQWSTGGIIPWRVGTGTNWLGADSNARDFGSNILVGDDDTGMVYFLDPKQGYDAQPTDDRVDTNHFTRIVEGQVPMRNRNTLQNGEVYLTGTLAKPLQDAFGVTLWTSDDAGNTFQSQGTVDVDYGDYLQDYVWRSLGLIQSPGRIFRIVDDGAFSRIEGLDMDGDG